MKISVNTQSSIRIESNGKVLYFDPFKIEEEIHDADYIFVTHDHYDHYDEESINNIKNDNTKIVLPLCLKDKEHNLLIEGYRIYGIDDIKFSTIPSYNENKPFHPREKYYVGYLIELEGKKLYIMGDTDRTSEADATKCDICFVPIGGTYTMDVDEAIEYINFIKPELAIPIHYGSIVGDLSLGAKFKESIDSDIKVELYIKWGEENDKY